MQALLSKTTGTLALASQVSEPKGTQTAEMRPRSWADFLLLVFQQEVTFGEEVRRLVVVGQHVATGKGLQQIPLGFMNHIPFDDPGHGGRLAQKIQCLQIVDGLGRNRPKSLIGIKIIDNFRRAAGSRGEGMTDSYLLELFLKFPGCADFRLNVSYWRTGLDPQQFLRGSITFEFFIRVVLEEHAHVAGKV